MLNIIWPIFIIISIIYALISGNIENSSNELEILKSEKEKLDKYGITHMLMYKKSKLRKFVEQNTEKYNLLYEDDNFCLFERKQVKESV